MAYKSTAILLMFELLVRVFDLNPGSRRYFVIQWLLAHDVSKMSCVDDTFGHAD